MADTIEDTDGVEPPEPHSWDLHHITIQRLAQSVEQHLNKDLYNYSEVSTALSVIHASLGENGVECDGCITIC